MAAKLILAASQGGSAQPGQDCRITIKANVRVPVCDGITRVTDTYRPDAPGKFPATPEYVPYDRAAPRTSSHVVLPRETAQ